MQGDDLYPIFCARCGGKLGYGPGLLQKAGEGRLLDEIRQKHFNCPKKERLLKKYVVLEHLRSPDRGLRFWSLNGPEPEKSKSGEVAYKVVLETNDPSEALKAACRTNLAALYST